MILRDYFCEHCGDITVDVLVDSIDEHVRCDCGFLMTWLPSPVEVRTENSRTYVDGTKRPEFDMLKKQVQIEDDMYDLPPNQRQAAMQELNDLRKAERKANE